MSKIWRAARAACLQQRCRQGWKDKAPYQRALTGEQPQTVHNTGLPITERVTSSSSIQRQYGHGLWVREQILIRSFSSEVVSDLGAHEGKAQEASFVETEADAEADADVDDPDSALQGTGLEKPGWDHERSKSQQALWSKIEVMRQSPQRSVVPHITQWLAEGYALDKRVLVTILIRLRRRARYKQAMEISDWMSQQDGITWEVADNIVRIDLKAKMKQFMAAEALLERSPAEFKTELAYHTLLKNYADQRMSHKAEAVLEKMKAAGLLTLPFAFNQMMLVYKRRGEVEKLPEVLEDMKKAGIKRDVYTYNIMMDVKARTGDIEGMEKIFEELKAEESVKPDAATYGTLASACVHAGLLDKAKIYLKEMEDGDVHRNRPAFDILVSQYGAVGDLEGVERVWEKIKSVPVVSNRSYITVIEAFGKLGQVEKAEEIFAQMSQEKGLMLTRQFNALLSAYTRQGMLDKAEKLLADMMAAGRKKNAITYHHIVIGYLTTNQIDKALAALNEAHEDPQQSRSKPWRETMILILDAYAKEGNVVNAEKYFQEYKKAYPKPEIRVYNILLKAYLNKGLPAIGFVQRLMADKLAPNDETMNLLSQQKGLKQDDGADAVTQLPVDV